MKKVILDTYKHSGIYFHLFDAIIAEEGLSKEKFLQDIQINPSTYRKCKKGVLHTGPKIVDKLLNHFEYKMPDETSLKQFELFLNDIYYKMYYKIYDTYEEDMQKLDSLINEKYIIFPIFKLFKLLLIISSNKSLTILKEENLSQYQDLKRYEPFFNDSLKEVFEIMYLMFEDTISEGNWLKNYTNGSAYYILSSRSYYNKRYIESIFFATKAKEFLEKDGNIVRELHLNNILMSSLLYVGNYEECYEIAFKQNLSLKSIKNDNKFLTKSVIKSLSISLLALQRFEEVVEVCEEIEEFTLTELTCYLIALYKAKGIEEYNKFLVELDIDNLDDNYKGFIEIINSYLINNKKTSLFRLENYDIKEYLIQVLKKF